MTPARRASGTFMRSRSSWRFFRGGTGGALRAAFEAGANDARPGARARVHRCSQKRVLSRRPLTCVNNGAKLGGRVVTWRNAKAGKRPGFLIDGGYGKIKGTTFRISNMGDETEATMKQLYAALDGAMRQYSMRRAAICRIQNRQLANGARSIRSLAHGETFIP